MAKLVKARDRLARLRKANALRFSGPRGCLKLGNSSGSAYYTWTRRGGIPRDESATLPKGLLLPLGLGKVVQGMRAATEAVLCRMQPPSRRSLRAAKEK